MILKLENDKTIEIRSTVGFITIQITDKNGNKSVNLYPDDTVAFIASLRHISDNMLH